MKDAQGHGSDPRGVSSGQVSPQAAARAMHSDHVVGGANDSTYHGPHTHAEYAREGVGDLAHRPGSSGGRGTKAENLFDQIQSAERGMAGSKTYAAREGFRQQLTQLSAQWRVAMTRGK